MVRALLSKIAFYIELLYIAILVFTGRYKFLR